MAYTVFTVPVHLRTFFTDRKLWAKARRGAWKLLKKLAGAAFAVECTHPVGDAAPEEFHPHLNFLWTRADCRAPWLGLDQVKAAWGLVLEALTGMGHGEKPVVVHHAYSAKEGKIKHWARYIARLFPGLHGWTGSQRWQGKFPRKPERECGCATCGNLFEFSRPIPLFELRRLACKALTTVIEIDGELVKVHGSEFLVDADADFIFDST